MEDESSVLMEPMVDFWGAELSGKSKTVTWPSPEEDLEPDVTVRLELRQACLGARAKTGDRNVVELTTEDENGESVTHAIVSLTAGGTEQSPLFLEVFPPVKLNLVAGSGPLHIVGSVHTELEEFDSDDEEFDSDDEEEEEEEELDTHEVMKGRKRRAESPPAKLAKNRKIANENGDGLVTSTDHSKDDEEEEDSEEEELEEESNGEEEEEMKEDLKTPQKAALVSKPKAKSVQKPRKSAGMKAVFKTPQPAKPTKTSGKVALSSAPTTPVQSKATKKGAKIATSMDDMKDKLRKTPNLPKKFDKFGNYIQQTFKVTDDKVKKQLWEFAQKVRTAK